MKTKKYYIIAIIMLVVLAVGCKATNISGEDMERIEKITYDDVVASMTDVIQDFADEYDYYTISDLEFIEDKLAVDHINRVKKFNNIGILLDIEVDSEEAFKELGEDIEKEKVRANFDELTKSTQKDLLERFRKENPLEYSKVGNIEITYIDKQNKLKTHSNIGNIRDPETMKSLEVEESAEEKLILERVFEHIEEDEEGYELKRLGIEEKTFIIEFNSHKFNEEGYKEKIKELSHDLQDLILGDEDLKSFLEEQGVNDIKISFYQGEKDTNPIIFEYKVYTG